MMEVVRLVTSVDLAGTDARTMSVSARHEAVLADGRRALLLDDRGWSGRRSDGGDPWEGETVEELERTARTVVGPDEGHTDADHWGALALTLSEQGVDVAPEALAALPHDVELSDRVRERIPVAR